jgi:hypothetical protein
MAESTTMATTLRRPPHGATLYKSVVVEADRAEMAKAAADALYSLAIVENERGRMADARENMLQAHRRYVAIGDAASAEDATSSLVRWSQLGASD